MPVAKVPCSGCGAMVLKEYAYAKEPVHFEYGMEQDANHPSEGLCDACSAKAERDRPMDQLSPKAKAQKR